MSGKLLVKGFTFGLAIFITYFLSGLGLGLVFSILPILSWAGGLAWLVSLFLQILACGLVGAIVFKYIH